MNVFVIFTGTDPASSAGGIGVVMGGYLGAAHNAGIPHVCIPTYRPGSAFGRFFLWLVRLPRLVSAVRRARKEYDKVVVYSHVGAGLSLLREGVLQAVARLFGADTIHHSHCPEAQEYLEHGLKKRLFALALSPADKVVVLTQFWKDFLESKGIRKPIEVIHNPLLPELGRRAQGPSERPQRAETTVLALSRLARGKGVDVAVAAAAYLPEGMRLVVAGDGAERENLERMARDLGVLDRVEFRGWVSGEAKAALLEEADIFCLPSTMDAYPMTFVEAMSYGLPVVGVRYAGIPDIVSHGETGLLVDRPDPELVAEALSRLADPQTRWRMGAAGQRRILEISSPEQVGRALTRVVGP